MWGTTRYAMALSRWVRRHGMDFDVLCASRMRIDAFAVLAAARKVGRAVVLRADPAGPLGDCQWHTRSHLGGRIRRRCRTADAIVVSDEVAAKDLALGGFSPEQVRVIANGIPAASRCGGGVRFDARLALAGANPDLTVANDTPVAVFAGRLREENGLFRLLESWQDVVLHRPDAKLWLFGDGPLRGELFRRISDLDLRSSVFLPGSSDDLQSVFQAANLFVNPSPYPGMLRGVLEAIAAGIPVAVVNAPDAIGSSFLIGSHARVAPPSRVGLSEAVLDLLYDPPSPVDLATAQRRVLMCHGLSAMVRRHLDLFEQLGCC